MTGYAPRAEISAEIGYSCVLRDDAQLLQNAIRDSVSTSPEAFLKTVADVNLFPIEYWKKEIDNSTWVVIQRDEEVVGIAVAKRPDHEIDTDIDPEKARFIESVWISPELRGYRIGERLVKFLLEVECKRSPEVRQFLLWVFDKNVRAIRLYERIGFVYTNIKNRGIRDDRTELKYQYQLTFDTATTMMKATETVVNEAARRADLCQFDVRYRILGDDTA
jgi:ribosomal protein S18 acetylase RimI-like enzyme